MGRVKRSGLLAAGGVSLLAAAAVVSSVVAPSAAVSAKAPGVPVTHVIEIMIENHSFDNLFGQFRGADGIPANTSLLNPNAYFDSSPAVHPVWANANEGDVTGEINNSTVAEQMAMDYQAGQGYLMDHYTVFPQDAMAAITEFGPPSALTGTVWPQLLPPGVTAPSSFPASASLSGGQANITVSFPSAGYWRIGASGPGGSKGWVTVDVGVTPDTAP